MKSVGTVALLVLASCRRYEGSGEAAAQARRRGIDYRIAFDQAFNGGEVLERFLALARTFDGAGAEGYGGDVCRVLSYVGYDEFTAAFSRLPSHLKESLALSIRHEMQGEIERRGETWFQERYPSIAATPMSVP